MEQDHQAKSKGKLNIRGGGLSQGAARSTRSCSKWATKAGRGAGSRRDESKKGVRRFVKKSQGKWRFQLANKVKKCPEKNENRGRKKRGTCTGNKKKIVVAENSRDHKDFHT